MTSQLITSACNTFLKGSQATICCIAFVVGRLEGVQAVFYVFKGSKRGSN